MNAAAVKNPDPAARRAFLLRTMMKNWKERLRNAEQELGGDGGRAQSYAERNFQIETETPPDFVPRVFAYIGERLKEGQRPSSARPAQPSSPHGLRTPKEVAARLGISVKQVKAHVNDGELKFVNMGRGRKNIRMMFADADVDEFIQRRAKRNTPQQQETQRSRMNLDNGGEVIGFTARRLQKKRK